MKNLINYLSKIRGYFSASQGNDVGYDCRLTVVRPSSDCRSTMLKLVSVLVILLTVGVGNAWGAEEVMYPSNGSTFNSGWNKTSRTARQTYAASTAAIQLMGESEGTYGEISSKSTYTGITAISVKATASGSKNLILYYSSNGSSWTEVSTMSISKNTSAYDKYDLTITGIPSSAVYVKFRAGSSSVYIYSVTVTTGGSSVATPTFSPAAGTYTSAQSVTISCATAGSTIYYTTDGTTPTSSSTVYSSAVSISSSCTLKAIAKKGSDYSSVASASYTINLPYTVSFSTGEGNSSISPVTETEQGEGITLPDGPTPACSSDGWVFAGWSATEYTSVPEATSVGRLYMPGDSYYPEDDETLYAVYRKLTSGKSTATFTASTRTGLTQISSGLTSPGWWYHTASGVEFYIKSYGYSSTYSSFDIWESWALIDAHTKIDKVVFTNYSTYTISSVELNDDEEDAGGSASLTGTTTQTITCSGDVTQLYLYSPESGDSYFTEFTVTYYNAKFSSNPTCASCDNDPTVTAASNNGSISSTSVPVQCESGISNIGGEGCTITSYGFCWAPSATTTTPTTSNSSYEVGTSYTVVNTAFSYTITGLLPNTEYSIRPYATNGHGTSYGTAYTATTLQQYAISYNNNGGSGSMASSTKDHGVSFTLPANAGTMTKTGYHATGWLLGSSSGTHYDLSGSYTTNEAATFYVDWTANTYEVAFNNNGGSGSMSNESFTYDAASKALTTCTFTPPEHKYFTGWNTAPGGGGTSYTDGQSVQNLTSTNNGTVTLYAQWADHTYTNYTTTCCATKITMAKSITGNGTVTFGKTSVPTCGGGSTTMTITPDAGWTLSTFTPSGVSPSSTSPAVATDEPDEQEIMVTFAADASGTYTATVVFVALHDKYFDRLHGNGESEEGGYHYYDKSGTGYSVPAPDEGDKTTGDDCTKEHYHFVGWLNADFLNSDGTPNTGAVGYEGPFSGGMKNATGATYYAIWSKEME